MPPLEPFPVDVEEVVLDLPGALGEGLGVGPGVDVATDFMALPVADLEVARATKRAQVTAILAELTAMSERLREGVAIPAGFNAERARLIDAKLALDDQLHRIGEALKAKRTVDAARTAGADAERMSDAQVLSAWAEANAKLEQAKALVASAHREREAVLRIAQIRRLDLTR
jgi:hypothetical protein